MTTELATTGTALAPTRNATIEAARAEAIAAVQARYVVAIQRPRDIDDVRVRLLRECARRGFAEVAMFARPVGRTKDAETGEWVDKIAEGPSIRFVEAAMRAAGNISCTTRIVRDDEDARVISVEVVDLETNYAQAREATVRKVTERTKLKSGQVPISVRTNSRGEQTYLVLSSNDDVERDSGAQASKAIRVCGLRMLPGDVVDECVKAIKATISKAIAEDPEGERKRLADGFATLNVMPSDVKGYLGHALEQSTPAELVGLRLLYGALRDGELTWRDVVAARGGEATSAEASGKPGANGSKLDAVLAKRAKAAKPEAAVAPTAAAPTAEAPGVPAEPAVAPSAEPPPTPSTAGPCRHTACTEMAAPGRDGFCDPHRLRPGYGSDAGKGGRS